MPGKTDAFESELLLLIFMGTAIPGIADAPASPLTTFWLSLLLGDPGDGLGTDQLTNEVTYAGYGRVGLARNSSNWTRAPGYYIRPTADVLFPRCTGGSPQTATHFGIGTAASGAGKLCYFGPLSPVIVCSTGVVPILTNTTSISEE
jgi:hypothetical protein